MMASDEAFGLFLLKYCRNTIILQEAGKNKQPLGEMEVKKEKLSGN